MVPISCKASYPTCVVNTIFFTIILLKVCNKIFYSFPNRHTFYFAIQIKIKFSCPNKGWKLVHILIMLWFSKQRKDPSCQNMFQKNKSFWIGFVKAWAFKWTETKTTHFWDFLRQAALLHIKPNKKCVNIIADSEWCKK